MSLWTPFFENPYSAPFAPPPVHSVTVFQGLTIPSTLRVEAKPFKPQGEIVFKESGVE